MPHPTNKQAALAEQEGSANFPDGPKRLVTESLHNSNFLESVTHLPANSLISAYHFSSKVHKVSFMKNERARPEEIEPFSGGLVTDSMVLEETFVDLAIRGQQAGHEEGSSLARGIINSVILGLLLWLLTLLLFIVS